MDLDAIREDAVSWIGERVTEKLSFIEMDLGAIRDNAESWADERVTEKVSFIKMGVRTWEFYLLGFTFLILMVSPFIAPGLYAVQDTTPNSEPYETVITFKNQSQSETYVMINCRPDTFITTERVAYWCDFRFEQSNGNLHTYNSEYIQNAIGQDMFIMDWSRRTVVKQGAYRPFTEEFIHQAGESTYTIHGKFGVIAPRSPEIYSFSIEIGEYFGGDRGDIKTVTVFSPTEASTLQTREFLMPFQRLIVVGILLSLLKFWIELFDRISTKIQK